MEFSVIVETTTKKIAATEDSVAELERYLLSAQISPKVLENIEPGKPHVLKKELSYKEAVDLSDRLMDFGLESEIHPPTKPELNKESEQTLTAAPQPKAATNESQNSSRDSNKPHGIKADNADKNTMLNNTVEIKATKPKSQTRAPLAKTKTTSPELKRSPQKISSTANTINKKANEASSTLKQQAEQIKSLFKIPKLGLSNTDISRFDIASAYFTAFLSLMFPALYILGVATLAVVGIFSAILFYNLIANFSVALWALSLLLISIPLLFLASLFSIPFFSKNKEELKPITLTAKDEPRLFMLTAAVCKIINTSTPEKIHVNFDGRILGGFSFNQKEFFALSKPLAGRPTLTICLSLLSNLSIRQYCSLLSRELGKQKHKKLLRPNAISYSQLKRFKKWKEKPGATSSLLQSTHNQLSTEKTRNFVETLISLSETIEYLYQSFFRFSYQSISKRLANDSVSLRYQHNVFGAEPAEPLTLLKTKMEHIAASRHEAIEMMITENESHRYASNLAALIDHLEEKHNSSVMYKVIDDSLIPKDGSLKTLIDNAPIYSAKITRDFYSLNDIDIEKAQLLSIDSLLKKESRDAKIEKVASEYFGKWHHGLQFWKLPKEAVLASIDKNHIIAVLNNCIGKLRYMSPDRPALIEKYYRLLKQLTEIKAAKKIRSTGFEYRLATIADNISNLDPEITARENQLQDIKSQLLQQNSTMGERIALGLLLDKDHEHMTSKLYTALSVLHYCSENLNNIAADCEELQTLINNSPKKISQHFNLQVKKVKDSIDENCKVLSRKLKKCPYDFIDQRHETLHGLLFENFVKADSPDMNKRTLQKGKISLTTIATSYKIISDLAANYATRMERLYKIESIRKL